MAETRVALLPLALGVLFLSGCAQSVATESFEGTPPGIELSLDREIVASWMDLDGSEIAVSMYMSSSCPSVPVAVEVEGDGTVVVDVERQGILCTTDQKAGTFVIAVPSDGSKGEVTVIVVVDGERYQVPVVSAP